MAKKIAKAAGEENFIDVEATKVAEIEVAILGTSPLLLNRLSEKTKHELLMPAPKKNAAEKQMHLKHKPYEEYRSSVYTTTDESDPTRIVFPAGAFRKSMDTSALDIPGCTKAQIGRLVRIVEYNVHIFGVPFLNMMPVRQAGIQRTPDIRTRAIVPHWACRFTIRFASPLLREKSIASLLDHAGNFVGVGDGRGEKGSTLSCGCFTQVGFDDPRWLKICATGGMAAQDAALANPETFDLTGGQDTKDLLAWFDEEIIRRDREPAKAGNGRKSKKEEVPS